MASKKNCPVSEMTKNDVELLECYALERAKLSSKIDCADGELEALEK